MFDDSHFKVFMPLYSAPGDMNDTFKKYKFSALLYTSIFIARRIILLYVAMFMGGLAWLQIILFVLVGNFKAFHIGYIFPHENYGKNVLEIGNELFTLLCAYLAMALIGFTISFESTDAAGVWMTWTLRVKLILNIGICLLSIIH